MFYIKRLFTSLITILICLFVTFLAFSVIPGDAALGRLSMDAEAEDIEALREELGLNDGVAVRFGKYLVGVVKGDFGKSFQYSVPVKVLVKERLPVTVWLAFLSMCLVMICSIPIGVLASVKTGGIIDKVVLFATQVGMAIPAFFLGIIITVIFGVSLRWFVPGAYVALDKDVGGFFMYLTYPAVAIAIPKIAMTVQFLRSSINKELAMDYVRTAKSKGNDKARILFVHVLKNAMIPVVTFFGILMADILAGSIVMEQVFSLPGVGRLLVNAISNRDYPVVQAVILYMASVVVVINLLVDLAYQRIDPRVRKFNHESAYNRAKC